MSVEGVLYVESGATAAPFDIESIPATYEVYCTLLDGSWEGGLCESATVSYDGTTLTLSGSFTTEDSNEDIDFTISGELTTSGGADYDILPLEMTNLQVSELVPGVAEWLEASETSYGVSVALARFTADGSLSVGDCSVSFGGVEYEVLEGSLTKEYSEMIGGNFYYGIVVFDMGEGYKMGLELTMYYVEETPIVYTPIDILGASAVEVDRDYGWGEIYTTLKIESTYTDGSETYPVSIEMDKPTDASGTTYATVTIGGSGDDDPWLGFVDGAELEYEVEDGWLTLTGKVANEWVEPKIYWDLYITAKLPVILGEGDNSAVLGTTANYVQVKRNFVAGQLYTLSLPFAINNVASVFGVGTVAYEYAALEEDGSDVVLQFKTTNTLVAGKPYLLQPANNVDGFTVNGVTLSSSTTTLSYTVNGTTVAMVPVLSALASNNGKYWLAENTWLYNDNVAVPALRALFTISTTSGIAPRARVAMNENAETGLENINAATKAVKAIENGQLIITIDGVKYNVQGVRL